MIKAYFADKDVGSVAALPGKLNGIPVWIHWNERAGLYHNVDVQLRNIGQNR